MPLSEYKESVGGGLKLKGVKDGRVKKHKSKTRKTAVDEDTGEAAQLDTSSRRKETESKTDNEKGDEIIGQEKQNNLVGPTAGGNKYGKTEAQLRYEERRRQMTEERVKKEGVKTHKERVEELNKYLSRLSEHHDMPKIGPG